MQIAIVQTTAYSYSPLGGDRHRVVNTNANAKNPVKEYTVNMAGNGKCTCVHNRDRKVPCRHMAVVMHNIGEVPLAKTTVYKRWPTWAHASAFKAAYASAVAVSPEFAKGPYHNNGLFPDDVILPPVFKKPKGRRRKNRYKRGSAKRRAAQVLQNRTIVNAEYAKYAEPATKRPRNDK